MKRNELNENEIKAIAALKRVAEIWPSTLWLRVRKDKSLEIMQKGINYDISGLPTPTLIQYVSTGYDHGFNKVIDKRCLIDKIDIETIYDEDN